MVASFLLVLYGAMLPAMPDVRAIFFDMDDTLVDDTGCYQRSIEGVCADLGPPFDAVTLQAAYGAVSTTWHVGDSLVSDVAGR